MSTAFEDEKNNTDFRMPLAKYHQGQLYSSTHRHNIFNLLNYIVDSFI